MKTKKDFFNTQSDLTACKIMFYRYYLQNYLAKVLMQFGRCFIADFFCGPGKNGSNNGSPLILLECASNMLNSPVLKKKWPSAEIVILFSDKEKTAIDNLKSILNTRISTANIKILGPFCETFQGVVKETTNDYQKIKEPKFFFLDPFGYSDVRINDIKVLMDCPASEVLLFLPTFHSYRFHKIANGVSALKMFLDEFTNRGCANYADIYDFNESIRQKLLSHMGLEYVRAIKLDDGKRKNALFYLTKHITGMLIMNDLAWKYAQDGISVKSKNNNEPTLFDLSTTSGNYASIKQSFVDYLKHEKQVSNVDIISFVAKNGFTTEYARGILRELKKSDRIGIEYLDKSKTKGFYVANNHWKNKLAVIKYRIKIK